MSMTASEKRSRLPAAPAAQLPAEVGLAEIARQLVDRAREEGVALTGDGGLLPALVARVLQTGLNVEFEDHVGYEPYALEGRGSGNSRNGTTPKTIVTAAAHAAATAFAHR